MEPALAIDFGTSRTKVAWREPDGSVHLLQFDGVPYLPSLFYLPQGTDEILLGGDARAAYEDDPLGVVAELKRKIQVGASIRTTEDRKVDPQEFLAHLFRAIKRQALEQIEAFGGLSPEQVWLTVPGKDSERLELVLKRAAKDVGWDMAQVAYEPVAAARYWLFGEGRGEEADQTVVVLDCGGGTTDWACLQRTGDRVHRSEEFPPGGISVGGADVDQALLDWVEERHPELHATRGESRLRDQLRAWKEAVLGGQDPTPIRFKGRPLGLDEAVLAQVYQQALLDKVMPHFERYLAPIIQRYPNVPVFLVGGSATRYFEKAVAAISANVHRSGDPIGAVIRGALATTAGLSGKSQTKQPDKREPPPNIHGWSTDKVQQLQQQAAEALGKPVFFRDTLEIGVEGSEMAVIPAATFLKGSPLNEPDRDESEGPQRFVTISESFAIGRYAVTFDEYDCFCEHTGRHKPRDEGWGRGNRPVINVGWKDANAYCRWLSYQTGNRYRLPKDVEWEFACRAGTSTMFWWGDLITLEQANYCGTTAEKQSSSKTVLVGEREPNPWGLYQLHGNIWEYCRWDNLRTSFYAVLLTTSHRVSCIIGKLRVNSGKSAEKTKKTIGEKISIGFAIYISIGITIAIIAEFGFFTIFGFVVVAGLLVVVLTLLWLLGLFIQTAYCSAGCLRGGSWTSSAGLLRSASRIRNWQHSAANIGFRLVQDLYVHNYGAAEILARIRRQWKSAEKWSQRLKRKSV